MTSAVRWARAWNDDEGNRGFRARILAMRGDLVVREYERARAALKRTA